MSANETAQAGSITDGVIQKLFDYGLFGTKITNFTTDEIETLSGLLFVEFVTKETIDGLKKEFHIANLPTVERESLVNNSELFVRLNSYYWRNKATGKDINFRSPFVFIILDYILQNKNMEVNSIVLKNNLGLSPKDISYALKFLKKHGIVDTNEAGLIKRLKISENQNKKIFATEKKGELPRLIKNYSYLEILKYELDHSKTGVTTSFFRDRYGFKNKYTLSDLNKIVEENPELYKVEESFDHKVRVNLFINKKYLEEINTERKKRLEGDDNAKKLKVVSREDRIFLLRKELEKNEGRALINNKICVKMAEIAGVNHIFDKKNILRLAEEVGLKVLKKNSQSIVYDSEVCTEENAIQFLEELSRDKSTTASPLDSFKKFVLKSRENILTDNGWAPNAKKRSRTLFKYLLNSNKFNYKAICEISVRDYLAIVKVQHSGFIQRFIMEAFLKKPEIFSGLESDELENWRALIKPEMITVNILPEKINFIQDGKLFDPLGDCMIKDVLDLSIITNNKGFAYGLCPSSYVRYFKILKACGALDFIVKDEINYTLHSDFNPESLMISGDPIKVTYYDRLLVVKHIEEEVKEFEKPIDETKTSLFTDQTSIVFDFNSFLRSALDNIPIIFKDSSHSPNNFTNLTHFFEKLFRRWKKDELDSTEVYEEASIDNTRLNSFVEESKPEESPLALKQSSCELIKIMKFLLLRRELNMSNIMKYYTSKKSISSYLPQVIRFLHKNKYILNVNYEVEEIRPTKKFSRQIEGTFTTEEIAPTDFSISDPIDLINIHSWEFKDYLKVFLPKIDKFLIEADGADFDVILEKIPFIEDFELKEFFEKYSDRFDQKNVFGFTVVYRKE